LVNFRRIMLFITRGSGRKRLGKWACLSKLRIRSSTRRGLLKRKGSSFCKQCIETCYSVVVNSSAHLSHASVLRTQELSSLRDITKHGASIVSGQTVIYSGDQFQPWNKVDFTKVSVVCFVQLNALLSQKWSHQAPTQCWIW
jgi:hypothetical protein